MDEVGLTLTGSDVAERDSEKRSSQLDEDIIKDGVPDSADDKELFDERPVALNTHLIDAFGNLKKLSSLYWVSYPVLGWLEDDCQMIGGRILIACKFVFYKFLVLWL